MFEASLGVYGSEEPHSGAHSAAPQCLKAALFFHHPNGVLSLVFKEPQRSPEWGSFFGFQRTPEVSLGGSPPKCE